jgi:hypothetical protein
VRVRLAIALLFISVLASVWLALGMDPTFAIEFGGVEMIALTRKLQWILLILTIVPCLALVVVVSVNRARVWWLLGLSIVVAMLFFRFSGVTRKPVRVLDAAAMPTLAEAKLASEDEYVVGVVFGEHAFAFPYSGLYRTPVVQLTDFDRRLILIHSPHANSATALETTREVRANDLEYVAQPGNSTMVYNRKYGQFVIGITGKTIERNDPTGVFDTVPTHRMPLMHWRRLHPTSKLMMPVQADAGLPGVPLKPKYPPRLPDESMPPETPIILVRTDPPAALLMGDYDRPVQTRAGDIPIVLWRDRGQLKAFNRTVDTDLFLTFRTKSDRRGVEQLIDNQTGSTWTYTGRCTAGPLEGKRLNPVTIEENVYWGVSREWFPDLKLIRQEN